MEDRGFNVRSFYKQHLSSQEENFTKATGMKIRHTFQCWNDGGKSEEIFQLKTDSGQECVGLDFGSIISYIKFGEGDISTLFLFDSGLTPILYEFSQMSDNAFDIMLRHMPSFRQGLQNVVDENINGFRFFVDQGMACVAKPVNCKYSELPWGENLSESFLMGEVLELLKYRITCSEEIEMFKGFSQVEKREMSMQEGTEFLVNSAKFVGKIALDVLFK